MRKKMAETPDTSEIWKQKRKAERLSINLLIFHILPVRPVIWKTRVSGGKWL